MTIIEQIKAEIERRIRSIENCPFIEAEFGASEKRDGKLIAYKDLLSFISTLESEKPMQDGLEEEIGKSIENLEGCTTKIGDAPEYHLISDEDLREFARHFAKWGADHTPLPEDTVLFNKGVAEGKRLMMQEAVEADVFGENYGSHRKVISEWLEPEIGNPGDKVRIIIVKED